MSLREFLNTRLDHLVDEGGDRSGLVGAMADASGVSVDDVDAVLHGHEECGDLDEAEAMGRALGLDATEILEVALGGAMYQARWCDPAGDGMYDWLAEQRDASSRPHTTVREGTNDFIASTDSEGRDGDIIDQSTWRLSQFRRNPVILEGHRTSEIVGRSTFVGVRDGSLLTTIQWDRDDTNPLGKLVASQHERGFRRAVSVRWVPGKLTARNELPADHPFFSKGKTVDGFFGPFLQVGDLHQNNTLIEISSVGPAGDAKALQTRGLGPDAARALQSLEPMDEAAVAALRDQLRLALTEPDEALDKSLRSLMLRFLLEDRDVQRAIRALNLTQTRPVVPPPVTEDEALIAHLWNDEPH